ncbi:hypothetical protein FOFC_02917 [Fusarium oxysporum]|nr:hypothetical protein FOFC_02917 [Fusarium oxysporum]
MNSIIFPIFSSLIIILNIINDMKVLRGVWAWKQSACCFGTRALRMTSSFETRISELNSTAPLLTASQ